jgi:hypothetical protein
MVLHYDIIGKELCADDSEEEDENTLRYNVYRRKEGGRGFCRKGIPHFFFNIIHRNCPLFSLQGKKCLAHLHLHASLGLFLKDPVSCGCVAIDLSRRCDLEESTS